WLFSTFRQGIEPPPDSRDDGAVFSPENTTMTRGIVKKSAFKTILLLPCAALALMGAGSASAAEAIPNISGVWQWGRCVGETGFGRCMLLEENDARLTERAKAYRDAIEEAAQPKYD